MNEEDVEADVVDSDSSAEESPAPQEGDILFGEIEGVPVMCVYGTGTIQKTKEAIEQYKLNSQDLHHATVLKIMAESIGHVSGSYSGNSDLQPGLLFFMEKEASARLRLIRQNRLNREGSGRNGS